MKLIAASIAAVAVNGAVFIPPHCSELEIEVKTEFSLCRSENMRENSCFFQEQQDVAKYWDCSSGTAIIRECPASYRWSETDLKCMTYQEPIDDTITCNCGPQNCMNWDCEQNYSSCYFPSANQHFYFECSNGTPYKRPCPATTCWDSDPTVLTCTVESCNAEVDPVAVFNPCDYCHVGDYNVFGICELREPFNEHKYLRCAGGKPTVESCPLNSVWAGPIAGCVEECHVTGRTWNYIIEECECPVGFFFNNVECMEILPACREGMFVVEGECRCPEGSFDDGFGCAPENLGPNCENCHPENEWEFKPEDRSSCYFPDYTNPHYFYECSNGTPYRMPCAANLCFNSHPEVMTCEEC